MSPTPFDIQRAPKVKALPSYVRHTNGSLLCRTCQAPANGTGFCRYHYYMEAVDNRGKQYSSLAQRPGKWLPPLVMVATFFLACAFIGVLALWFFTICPLLMAAAVFGTRQSERHQRAQEAARHNRSPSVPGSPFGQGI